MKTIGMSILYWICAALALGATLPVIITVYLIASIYFGIKDRDVTYLLEAPSFLYESYKEAILKSWNETKELISED